MDNNFDPDAYLAQKAPDTAFDPDAYLAEKQTPTESAARGFLRNVPGGQQAVAGAAPYTSKIADWAKQHPTLSSLASPIVPLDALKPEKSTYSAEMEHLTQSAEQGKEQNYKSYLAGSGLGTALPMALGQPEGIIANGVLGAGVNAVQSASDVNLTAPTYQDAKQAGLAAIIGGGLGAAGTALGAKFMPKAVPGASSEAAGAIEKAVQPAAETAEAMAPKAAPVSTRIPGGILPDKTPVATDFVPSGDRIAASNWARAIGFTPRKFASFAKEIGENPETAALEGQAWSQEKGLIKWMDHPGEALSRVSKIKDEAGAIIGDTIKKFGTERVPAEDIWADLTDLAEKTAHPNAKGTLENVAKRVEQLSAKGNLDWQAMNELKGMVGKEVHQHPNLAKAYGQMAETMNGMVDATAKRIGDPTLRATYEVAKRDFRMGSLLEPSLRYSEAKNLIGGPAGHNTLRGVLGELVEAFTGAPPIGQMAKNVMATSAPAIKAVGNAGSKARTALAPAAKGLSQAAHLELSNFLQSQYKKK